MFIPEMSDDDFVRYYRGSWAMVTHGGLKTVTQWLCCRDLSRWWDHENRPLVISRDSIKDIQVPALGYHVVNDIPVFSARVPSRTTTKGLSQENSRSYVPKDFAALTNAAVDWCANKQPTFDGYVGSVKQAVATVAGLGVPFAVVNPELLAVLNCTDGTPGVFVNLYYREFLIGKYNNAGRLVEGDAHLLQLVGAL